MLLLPGNSSVAQRVQGSFVSEEEVRKVVAHWRRQAPEVEYVSGVEGERGPVTASGMSAQRVRRGDDDDDEAILRQAMELVVRSQLGSTSMLQRKLKIGFARAGRVMDLLEQRGVVGPERGLEGTGRADDGRGVRAPADSRNARVRPSDRRSS